MSEPLSPVGEAMLRAERDDALAGYDRMKAEVERLRAELKLYKEARARDIERANEAIAREDRLANDFAAAAQEINGLRAEVRNAPMSRAGEALLRAEKEDALGAYDRVKAKLAELEAENAELRGKLVRHEHALAAVQSENWECAQVLAQHIDWNAELRARVEGIRVALTEHQRAIVQEHLDALDDPKPSGGT